jgi:PAS domain S-box-containing protein
MPRFLIIDDNPDNLVTIQVLLSDSFPGSEIIKAINGDDGISEAHEKKPDVILLDIRMPGLNGFEVCAILKNDFRVKNIPVIIMTADNPDKATMVKALESGAESFISKPIEEAELTAKVASMLRIKKSEDKIRIEREILLREVNERTSELEKKLIEQKATETDLRNAFYNLERNRLAALNLMEDLRDEIEVRKRVETDLRSSETKFRTLFTSMQEGFALHQIINDDTGHAVDYKFLDVNPAFEKLTGLNAKDIIGRRVLEVMPGTERFWIEKYGRVANEMTKIGFEHFSKVIKKYYRVLAFSPSIGLFATLFEDVTEHRVLEKTLRENEEKFRTIFESIGSGLIYMNNRGKILDVNPAFEILTGLSKEIVTDNNILGLAGEILKENDTSDLLMALTNTLSGKTANSISFNYNDRFLTATSFFSANNKMIIGVITDLTLQKKAEDERFSLLTRNKSLLGAVPDILMEINTKSEFIWANEVGLDFFGREVLGKPAHFFSSGKQNAFAQNRLIFGGSEEAVYLENIQIRKDGEKRLLAWWWKTMKNQEGVVTGALSSARDITEIKNRELELERSREQLEQLNLYLQRVREEERKLISRELHDELGQALTAIKIDLGALKLSIDDKKSIKSKVEKISSLVSDSIVTVQRLTSELRPHVLDDLGLEAAIKWYTDQFIKRTGLSIILNIDRNIELPSEIQLVIFRIIQESLTNVARHSKAKHIELNFFRTGNNVLLEIQDDGIGISEEDKKSSKSLGLFNMSERAKEIGGKLIIESTKKQGTKICLTVPDLIFNQD